GPAAAARRRRLLRRLRARSRRQPHRSGDIPEAGRMIAGHPMQARCAVATAILAAAALAGTAAAQVPPPPKIVVGDDPSLAGAPLYIALEKGYYREAGLDVQLQPATSADMAVPLATNRVQVVGGALSAGFFNSLSKGLPIGLLMSRATSP